MHKHNNNTRTKIIFGFWLYIMSDCILFATFFAVHSVLYNNEIKYFVDKNILSLSFILIETCFLLLSSLTCAISMIHAQQTQIKKTNVWMIWMGMTFLLGLCFICMECYEFNHLIKLGYYPCNNAFFSSFFTLLGTHGIHVIIGLVWILLMLIHVKHQGLTLSNCIRLECLSLFWHFLDIIWICVFTEVYLLGMVII